MAIIIIFSYKYKLMHMCVQLLLIDMTLLFTNNCNVDIIVVVDEILYKIT